MDLRKTGYLIAQVRKELGLTQKQLAEKLNISDRTISKWERGAGFPDITLLIPLADALGITVVSILQGEREPKQSTELTVRDAVSFIYQWSRQRFRRAIASGLGAILAVTLFFCLLYHIFGSPFTLINNARLEKSLKNVTGETVFLEDVVPFQWTSVFTFDPYTPLNVIQKATGSKSPSLDTGVSEGMINVVFMNGPFVAASVYAYPSSVGYALWIENGADTHHLYPDGGYDRISYGDYVEFTVEQQESHLLFRAQVADSTN